LLAPYRPRSRKGAAAMVLLLVRRTLGRVILAQERWRMFVLCGPAYVPSQSSRNPLDPRVPGSPISLLRRT